MSLRSRLPLVKARPTNRLNDGVCLRRSGTEPFIRPRGINVYHEIKRPRKIGAAKNEKKGHSISNIFANSRIEFQATDSNKIERIAENLRKCHSALEVRFFALLERIGDSTLSMKLDRDLRISEILRVIHLDQCRLSEVSCELLTSVQALKVEREQADAQLQHLREDISSVEIDEWKERKKIISSLKQLEGHILSMEPNRQLPSAPASISKDDESAVHLLVIQKLRYLQDLVSVMKHRLARYEHNTALKKCLDEFESLPSLLERIGELEMQNEKLRQREMRFQHDPLTRRRNMKECTAGLAAGLITALQNELLTYRQIYVEMKRGIDHPMQHILKELPIDLEAPNSVSLDVDAAYDLLVKRLSEAKGREANCSEDQVVVDEKLLRILLKDARPQSAPKNADMKMKALLSSYEDEHTRLDRLYRDTNFQMKEMKHRVKKEFLEGDETLGYNEQTSDKHFRLCREQWLVKRDSKMTVEKKMAAVYCTLEDGENLLASMQQQNTISELISIVHTISQQKENQFHLLTKTFSILYSLSTSWMAHLQGASSSSAKQQVPKNRVISNEIAASALASEKATYVPWEMNTAGVPVQFAMMDQKETAKLPRRRHELRIKPEALGIRFEQDSPEMICIKSYRRLLQKLFHQLFGADRISLCLDDFLSSLCKALSLIPNKLSKEEAIEIFHNSLTYSTLPSSLDEQATNVALIRLSLRVFGDADGSLEYPENNDKITAFLTNLERAIPDLLSHQRRPHARAPTSGRIPKNSGNLKLPTRDRSPRGFNDYSTRSGRSQTSMLSAGSKSNRNELYKLPNELNLKSRNSVFAGSRGSRRRSNRSRASSRKSSASSLTASVRPESHRGRVKCRTQRSPPSRASAAPALQYHVEPGIVSETMLNMLERSRDSLQCIFAFYGVQRRFRAKRTTALVPLPETITIGHWELRLFASHFRLVPFLMSVSAFDRCLSAVLTDMSNKKIDNGGEVSSEVSDDNETQDTLGALDGGHPNPVNAIDEQLLEDGDIDFLGARLQYHEFCQLLVRLSIAAFSTSSTPESFQLRNEKRRSAALSLLDTKAPPYLLRFLDIDITESELKLRLQRTSL